MTPARSARALVGVCAALVLAAALLWVASAVTWARVGTAGGAPVEVAGAAVVPGLTGTALLALAGVAGVVAAGGVLRRLLGLLCMAAAVFVAVETVSGWNGEGALLPDGVSATGPGEPAAAPWLALLGAVVLLAAGAVVAVREPRLARLGSRYGSGRRARAGADPDRAAWDDLDEGRDPTVPAAGDGDPGRGDGR
ncbi:MAG TPA: Trp biosynthesis-associated membrane protein, partial [Pseudonocardia sp.]|nr:Trp biosynthesis-associated membrane protein [Pseudonocardia sp.]